MVHFCYNPECQYYSFLVKDYAQKIQVVVDLEMRKEISRFKYANHQTGHIAYFCTSCDNAIKMTKNEGHNI